MTTSTKTLKQPGFLDRPIGIIFILLVITVLWGLSYQNVTAILLVVITAMLFFGLQRPVWAMAALMVYQFTIVGYMVETPFGFKISLQLLMMILIGLIVWRSYYQKQFDLGPRAKSLLLAVGALILIAMISDIINSGPTVAFKDFRDLIVGLMIVSFLPVVIRDLKDLKTLCAVSFILIAASSVIGVMQHFNILGMQTATLVPAQADTSFRVLGMTVATLELSYTLSSIIVILIALVALKGFNSSMRPFVPVIILIATGALYFTYTRSALMAIGFGIIALFLLVKTRLKGEIIMIGVLLISAFLMISPLGGQYLSGRSEDVQENSTVSRQILWQAGVNMALDHPIIGIGSANFNTLAAQYQTTVDSSLLAYEKREFWSYRTLGNEPPHNDFINIWLSYGTPALIIFILIFLMVTRNFLDSYRSSTNHFLRGLSIGLAAALIAYGINAIYHNLLSTMPLFWILAGFSLAVTKLTSLKQSRYRVK